MLININIQCVQNVKSQGRNNRSRIRNRHRLTKLAALRSELNVSMLLVNNTYAIISFKVGSYVVAENI